MTLHEYLSRIGETKRLAFAVGVAPSVVSQWKYGVRQVPAERCPGVERATGGRVRCETLRPDVDWAVLRATAAAEA